MSFRAARCPRNGLPKYVALHSPTKSEWNPTTILTGDIPARVAELKRQPGRDLQIHGNARPAQQAGLGRIWFQMRPYRTNGWL
jgi:hypothetical protein